MAVLSADAGPGEVILAWRANAEGDQGTLLGAYADRASLGAAVEEYKRSSPGAHVTSIVVPVVGGSKGTDELDGCPHVHTGEEGTSYCDLAAQPEMERHTVRYWRVVDNETGGIPIDWTNRCLRDHQAREAAEEWIRDRAPERYHVEVWDQTWQSMPDVWTRVEEEDWWTPDPGPNPR